MPATVAGESEGDGDPAPRYDFASARRTLKSHEALVLMSAANRRQVPERHIRMASAA